MSLLACDETTSSLTSIAADRVATVTLKREKLPPQRSSRKGPRTRLEVFSFPFAETLRGRIDRDPIFEREHELQQKITC
jgi:hypothetical protein